MTRKYLLFVGDTVADHDILAADFVKAFLTAKDAMDYYDEHYTPDTKTYKHDALVAKFDNEEFFILYRTKFMLGWPRSTYEHPFEFRKNWLSAWQTVGDIWEGRDAPRENVSA